MDKTKILIADDHPIFRSGVKSELEQVPHFEIIAETGDGNEAFNLIQELGPDVAVLDFQMPGKTGLEIATKLQHSNTTTQFILLTMFRDKKIVFKALDSGVKGYVLKDDAVFDIVNAVEKVASGEHFISENLTGLLVERLQVTSSENKTARLIENLTPAELKILSLIAKLKSNDEIAEILYISKRTVENHKVNISGKLELKGARELLKFAMKNKELID